MDGRQLPIGQGLGGLGEGPPNRARAVRTLCWRRRHPCGAGGAASRRWTRPGRRLRRRRPHRRPGRRVRGASGLPGGPAAAAAPGPARPGPRPPGRPGPGRPGGRPPPPGPSTHRAWRSNVCSGPWRQPINPPPEHKAPTPNLGTTPARGGRRAGSRQAPLAGVPGQGDHHGGQEPDGQGHVQAATAGLGDDPGPRRRRRRSRRRAGWRDGEAGGDAYAYGRTFCR
jgi:hypothetical protein